MRSLFNQSNSFIKPRAVYEHEKVNKRESGVKRSRNPIQTATTIVYCRYRRLFKYGHYYYNI